MAKVFDKDGNIIDADKEAVYNDLTKAPIYQEMPEGMSYIPIIIPGENQLLRIALINPNLIATNQSIEEIILAVNQARQGLVDSANRKHAEQDSEVQSLKEQLANIQLIPGERGLPGIDGKDGINGAKGDKGEQGLKGDTGLKGDKGDQGLPGTNGTNGVDGKTPTLIVGNVTTVASGSQATANVRLVSGTQYAVDLGIPKGDTPILPTTEFAMAVFTVTNGVLASKSLFGISAVTRISTGKYRITFSSAQADLNFACFSDCRDATNVRFSRCGTSTLNYVEVLTASTSVVGGVLSMDAADSAEVSFRAERKN